MDPQKAAKKRISQLRLELDAANESYFDRDENRVPEPVRDQLKKELISLETDFPELSESDSPTQKVGTKLSSKLPKLAHKTRKFSLADVFERSELIEFDARVKRFLKIEQISYSVEVKIDGLNITIWYQNGELQKAITRGDGQMGEDVTHCIRTIKSLPENLGENLNLEISGEVFIQKSDFWRVKKSDPNSKFKNPRNLAAGTVRQLDAAVAAARNLKIFLYDLGQNNLKKKPQTQSELFTFFDQKKIPRAPDLKVFNGKNAIEKVADFCEKMSENLELLEQKNYSIDGLVIKVHDFEPRARLGHTAKTAKYAVAWKFPATEKYTQLRKIHFQVGRTGKITPVAILQPVEISGSSVSRATLHNFDEIVRKEIQLGDWVIVRKAGEIIPEILAPIKNMREGTERKIEMIKTCPDCTKKLFKIGPEHFCKNQKCPARQRQNLFYFAQILKIESLGPRTIDGLIELGAVQSPPDFWKLTEIDLAPLPLFREKKIQNLLANLQARKNLTLAEFFTGSGIELVGAQSAGIFAEFFRAHFGEFSLAELNKKIDQISLSDLENLDGVGEKVAKSFFGFVRSGAGKKLFADFAAQNLQIFWPPKTTASAPLSGKNVVITGSFEKFSREEIKKKITDRGAKVLSAVSKNANILICGQKPGSKLKKAIEIGEIEIWQEADLVAKLAEL